MGGYLISLLVFCVVRSKSKSMIKRYQRSVTESSANGLTNLSVFMAMIILHSIFIAVLIKQNVSIELLFNKSNFAISSVKSTG